MKLITRWFITAIAVAVAAVTYAYTSGLIGSPEEETPVISFEKDDTDNTLTILTADPNLNWDDIEVLGIANKPSGTIEAGDQITDCSGEISLIWMPSNSLYGTWTYID